RPLTGPRHGEEFGPVRCLRLDRALCARGGLSLVIRGVVRSRRLVFALLAARRLTVLRSWRALPTTRAVVLRTSPVGSVAVRSVIVCLPVGGAFVRGIIESGVAERVLQLFASHSRLVERMTTSAVWNRQSRRIPDVGSRHFITTTPRGMRHRRLRRDDVR